MRLGSSKTLLTRRWATELQMTNERDMVPEIVSASARGKKQSAWYVCDPMSNMATATGVGTRLIGVILPRVYLRSSAMAGVGTILIGNDTSILVSGFSSNEVSPGIC